MPVKGTEAVLENIVIFGGGFLKHLTKTMDRSAAKVEKELTRSVSLRDHSLAELRALGYPYARRHGELGIQIHDPYWLVHRQGGTMREAVYRDVDQATAGFGTVRVGARIGIDETKAPHAAYVVFGTSKMVPRDALSGSLDASKADVEKTLKEGLKNAVVEFRGR